MEILWGACQVLGLADDCVEFIEARDNLHECWAKDRVTDRHCPYA